MTTLDRGVYTHTFTTPGGKTILYAVNSRGEKVAESIINEDIDRAIVAGALWDILGEVDLTEADTPPLTILD